MEDNTDESNRSVVHASFNQDHGCFALAHAGGFVVYNTHPVELRVHRTFDQPVAMVSMLHRTNYLAVVGKEPLALGLSLKLALSNRRVTIWDDLKRKPLLLLDFDGDVKGVLLSRVRIIVVLQNQIKVFGFVVPPKLINSYETADNPYGLGDLLVTSNQPIFAFPGRQPGQIQIVDVSGEKALANRIIKAHKAPLRCLAVNLSATLVATALQTGTIIRIHLTATTALVYEFRRGIERTEITLMKFSHNDKRLAVLSNKGTLHIFGLDPQGNRHHLLKRVQMPLPMPQYFNLTWLACLINIEGSQGDEGTVGWLDETVVVVWKHRQMWEQFAIIKEPGPQWFRDEERWRIERVAWKRLAW